MGRRTPPSNTHHKPKGDKKTVPLRSLKLMHLHMRRNGGMGAWIGQPGSFQPGRNGVMGRPTDRQMAHAIVYQLRKLSHESAKVSHQIESTMQWIKVRIPGPCLCWSLQLGDVAVVALA